ncbi:RNA recognition motif (RRM)-containing protein [Reticulomyxa filosa]|uniref:RNA recognition motif (RRM)-containing protein n=1 Tax=Reticulomyxa filosa TaxID=46433 RepID=X6P227_RETFI|nr:RNA recognition motif (RRM)-containing protein [Reticulomyxa filosa]|eukprot:ETO31612.1 RNA recognition motif (RRM)-containing protein [Reticulomyxa filosa]
MSSCKATCSVTDSTQQLYAENELECQEERLLSCSKSNHDEESTPSVFQSEESESTEKLVQLQVDYYFSDENLKTDNYLLSCMHEDPEYWVPVKTVLHLSGVRALTRNEKIVMEAIRKSKLLILNANETKIKRPNFVPPKPRQNKNLRRTVFLYGLPPSVTKEEIMQLCQKYGVIRNVYLDVCCTHVQTTPSNSEVKTLSDGADFSPKTTVDKDNELSGIVCPGHRKSNHRNNNNNTKIELVCEENTEEEIQAPDRETAEIFITNKFCPRLSQWIPFVVGDQSGSRLVLPKLESPSDSKDESGPVLSVDTKHANNQLSNPIPFCSRSTPRSNKSLEVNDFRHLRSAFVVFESQSQANKCVRGQMHSNDGIFAMHQYDFNKQRKKVTAFKAQGLSPLFDKNSQLRSRFQKFTFEPDSTIKFSITPHNKTVAETNAFSVSSECFSRSNVTPLTSDDSIDKNNTEETLNVFPQSTVNPNTVVCLDNNAKATHSFQSHSEQAYNQKKSSCPRKYFRSRTAPVYWTKHPKKIFNPTRSESKHWRNFNNKPNQYETLNSTR